MNETLCKHSRVEIFQNTIHAALAAGGVTNLRSALAQHHNMQPAARAMSVSVSHAAYKYEFRRAPRSQLGCFVLIETADLVLLYGTLGVTL